MSDVREYWTLEEVLRIVAEEEIPLDFATVTLGSIQSSGLSRGALVEGLRMLSRMQVDDGRAR